MAEFAAGGRAGYAVVDVREVGRLAPRCACIVALYLPAVHVMGSLGFRG
jgi:hypothetical protein